MIHLNLASNNSRRFHEDNVWYDFTTELPQAVEGKFTCALLEFSSQSSMVEDLYVFCDLCEPEYVQDSVLPLLRIVSEPGEVSIPYFKPVSRQVIQRVHITIRNQNLEVPSNSIGPVRITLGLERI